MLFFGYVVVVGGAFAVWSGIKGENPRDVLLGVLTNSPAGAVSRSSSGAAASAGLNGHGSADAAAHPDQVRPGDYGSPDAADRRTPRSRPTRPTSGTGRIVPGGS